MQREQERNPKPAVRGCNNDRKRSCFRPGCHGYTRFIPRFDGRGADLSPVSNGQDLAPAVPAPCRRLIGPAGLLCVTPPPGLSCASQVQQPQKPALDARLSYHGGGAGGGGCSHSLLGLGRWESRSCRSRGSRGEHWFEAPGERQCRIFGGAPSDGNNPRTARHSFNRLGDACHIIENESCSCRFMYTTVLSVP